MCYLFVVNDLSMFCPHILLCAVFGQNSVDDILFVLLLLVQFVYADRGVSLKR